MSAINRKIKQTGKNIIMKTSYRRGNLVQMLSLVLCTMCGTLGTYAQGYLTDATNSNAVLTRDPARQASTEIDAVVTNPAGTAFMEDGLHLSASGIFSRRSISFYDMNLPSFVMDAKETRILPAVQVAYKKNEWAVSASFASEGGYGRRKSPDGDLFINGLLSAYAGEINESFQEMNALLMLMNALNEVPDLNVSLEDNMIFESRNVKSKLYNWTTRLGMSYRINSNISAYIGLKAHYISSKQTALASLSVVRPSTGEKWLASDYSQNIIDALERADFGDIDVREFQETITELTESLEAVSVESESSYDEWGFAPVIGLDYTHENFNFGAKYEFPMKMNSMNLPAFMSVGLSWQALKKWKFAAGSNIVFATDKSIYTSNDVSAAYNISGSATFDINEKWLVSGGYTFSHEQLLGDDFSIPLNVYDSHRISLGAAFRPIPKMQIDLGVSTTVNGAEWMHISNNTGFVNNDKVEFTRCGHYEFKPRVQVALGISYCL